MKPSLKPRQSYEKAGRPRKEFEELHRDNQRRRSDEFLKQSGMSIIELLEAAKLKAQQEGLSDASFVLESLASNPIEQGEIIRNSMTSSQSQGMDLIL